MLRTKRQTMPPLVRWLLAALLGAGAVMLLWSAGPALLRGLGLHGFPQGDGEILVSRVIPFEETVKLANGSLQSNTRYRAELQWRYDVGGRTGTGSHRERYEFQRSAEELVQRFPVQAEVPVVVDEAGRSWLAASEGLFGPGLAIDWSSALMKGGVGLLLAGLAIGTAISAMRRRDRGAS